MEKDKNFPQWLSVNGVTVSQTSGIAFIETDSSGNKIFLMADDIGAVNRIVINDTSIVSINNIFLSENVRESLARFSKLDFEEILYDKYTGSVYIFIEGNMPDPIENSGIFKLNFAGNNIYSDTISSVEELNITPRSLFRMYLGDNVGYEGMAADENYFYLGLEGFPENNIFADSTVLFVVDKSSLKIVKEINTKALGIYTICGLYSDKNRSVYGVDRNNKKVFHLVLDEKLNVTSDALTDITTGIPGYPSLDYVASFESITMDDDKALYLIVDPWKRYYIPPDEVLKQLDEKTINNFKKYIPVIYKYKLIN
ncbi:MAG: hypothetical protein R6W90_12560 [Ignavibacteriaceae bacterium]